MYINECHYMTITIVINACFVRVMKCVTIDIYLTYERIHIFWTRYETNLVMFYSYSNLDMIFSVGMICSRGGSYTFLWCDISDILKKIC